jgi:hypothetical protein
LKQRIFERLDRSRTRAAIGRAAVRSASVVNRRFYLPLEYPPAASQQPRWGYGRPRHPWLAEIVGAGEDRYRESLQTILGYADALAAIPHAPTRLGPGWVNGSIPGLDGAAIYSFVRFRAPRLYLEVGSGNSTKFARQAIADGGASTTITSIDPVPRAEIDEVCDRIVREPLETVDLSVFGELRSGDVVFFDGSHRVFTNSDVTVFFLEVLPSLPPGVLVGIHDIYLPDDYPPRPPGDERHWSEQYMLAAYLLGGGRGLAPALASIYASRQPDLASILEPLWSRLPDDVEPHGAAFWLEKTAAG